MRELSAKEAGWWRLLLGGLGAALLVLLVPATSGASMPGGNGRIAFNKAVPKGEFNLETGVWSINPDGTGLLQLAGGEKDAVDATYSPDGSRLVFDRYDELWTATADGSGARVLSPGNDRETERTRWVHNYEDPETGEIVEWVKIDEEREERDAYSEASFSPNGAVLAVVHYTGAFAIQHVCSTSGDGVQTCSGSYSEVEFVCDDCASSIDAIDSVTAAPLGTLVPRSTTSFLDRPVYSSTGALAYEEVPNDHFDQRQVRLIPTPGAAPVVVASGEAGEPDFSPDGSRIVFAVNRHEIGVVAVAGGPPSYVSLPQPEPDSIAYSVRAPVWSPDGSTIAFGNIGANPSQERYTEGGIYLMHPDGSGIARVQGDAAVPTAWQPIPIPPPPPPPAVRARALGGKKKIKLSRKGIGVVGKIVCGSSPCALKAGKSKLKIGKKRYGVKALVARSLAAGATAPVRIKVKGKALAALKAKHRGRLLLTLSVADAAGAQTLSFKPKVVPAAAKRHKKKAPPKK